jgi:diguanylate cyclase (GGDEF)-like protein
MIAWLVAGMALLAAPAPLPDTAPPPPVSLAGAWSFRTGDDLRWADPALEARGWTTLEVPSEWESVAPGYDGFGWYRREVMLPPALAEGPVGVRLGTVADAFEVYWNGVRIGGKGAFPPHFVEGVHPSLFLVPARALAAGAGGKHVMAVRVYNAYAYGGMMGGARVGRYDVLVAESPPRETVIGGLISFFLAIGIYHLAFYLRRRRARENLSFALLCVLVALFGATYSSAFASAVGGYVNPYRLGLLAELAAAPVFMRLVARLFDFPFTRLARGVELLFLAALPLAVVLPLPHLWEFNDWVDLGIFAGLLTTVWRVGRAASPRNPHARALALGTVAFAATVVWDLGNEYGTPVARVLPGVPGLFWIGFLCFLLSVGIATAGKWARAEMDARTDTLTGLSRRHVFEQALRREAERLRRSGGRLALVIIDLDHFKRINDTWGHRVGDEVLTRVGRLLRHSARNIDVAARLGGEEFGVLLFDPGPVGAQAFVERFRGHLARLEVTAPGGPVKVTASIGVAVAEDLVDPDELLDAADRASYRAKQEGRDRLVMVALGPGVASPAPDRRSPGPA